MTAAFRLEPRTIQILNHFARLNNTISLDWGTDIIRTITPQRTLYARAIKQQPFPDDLTLYDLRQFLRAVKSAGSKHSISIDGGWVVISGEQTYRIRQANADEVLTPPFNEPKWSPVADEFNLTRDTLARIVKAWKVLGVTSINAYGKSLKHGPGTLSVVGCAGQIFLEVVGCNHPRFRYDEIDPDELLSGEWARWNKVDRSPIRPIVQTYRSGTVGKCERDFAPIEFDQLDKLLRGNYRVEIRTSPSSGHSVLRFVGYDIEYVMGTWTRERQQKCGQCGAEFVPIMSSIYRGPVSHYCSFECETAASEKRQEAELQERHAKIKPKTCRWCQVEFKPSPHKDERCGAYCSFQCQDAAIDYRVSRQNRYR